MTRDEMQAEIDSLKVEVKRLKCLIDRDRTGLARGLCTVQGICNSFGWLASSDEWGSYEWHERTEKAFRDEVATCFEEIETVASEALRVSGRRAFEAFHGIDRKVLANTVASQ